MIWQIDMKSLNQIDLNKRGTLNQLLILSLGILISPKLSALPGIPSPSLSQDAPSLKPYDMIEPPIKADINTVRVFFSYGCPYCRTYHNGLALWGESLPQPLKFASTPLITSPDDDNQVLAVYGRLIAGVLNAKSLPAYDLILYELFQGDSEAGAKPATNLQTNDILKALVDAGIDAQQLKDFLRGEAAKELESKIVSHAKIIQLYGIKATPSVAIGGRFLVNPDQADGNAQQFLVLLNGIVSRILGVRSQTS